MQALTLSPHALLHAEERTLGMRPPMQDGHKSFIRLAIVTDVHVCTMWQRVPYVC